KTLAEVCIANLPLRAAVRAESLELCEEPFAERFNNLTDVWTIPTGDQSAVFGYEIHKSTKRQFHCVEIFINVRVIEFDVVYDRELGQVVHELRTFVEVSGVVFVGFDEEVIAVRDAKTRAEVLRYTTDEESRVESALVHDPRRNAGSRRLAVRARDRERVTPANELFFHDLRLRSIKEFAFERFFDFRISARDCVTDDHAVRKGREMFAFVTVEDVDAEVLQHRGHRWIDVLVRSGDVMSACLKHAGERSHRGSADAD